MAADGRVSMGTVSARPVPADPRPAGEPGPPGSPRRSAAELAQELEQLEFKPGYDARAELADAERIEREAEALGDLPLQMRARLVQGDMLERLGEPAGSRLILAVNRWAEEAGDGYLTARSHHLLSFTFHNVGDPAGCLDHAVRALEGLSADAPARVRAQYLTTLADALGWLGSFAEARARYREAEDILVAADDHRRQVNLLNNLAYTEYEAGEPQRAWETVQRMLTVAAAHDVPLDAAVTDTVARAMVETGRYDEAIDLLQREIETPTAPRYDQSDTLPEYLLTLAEAQRRVGRPEEAQATLDRCGKLCAERDLAVVRVRIQAEQAELYASTGDFARAYTAHKEYHRNHESLRSLEREAQARARQALFETAEARAQAERFREQALRDPLTRLYNRRYVDERVPAILVHAAQTGTPVTAAVLDLDHFKRINDTFSHDVGDRVLVTFAGLLGAVLDDGAAAPDEPAGFAARLGGEEFLLVMVGIAAGEAVERIEKLRLAVADHPWQPITGDIPVTVSVGVTTAHPESTKASLLARADHCLYTAKRDGRDRLHVDPAAVLERRRYRGSRG